MSIAPVSPQMPVEMWCKIVGYLEEDRDVARFSAVCKLFKAAVDSNSKMRLRRLGIYDFAFGKAKWTKYFGDIGTEPSLPADIDKIINVPCPIWAGKKVRETHMLTLVPSHVNGKQLTLESIGELVKNPKEGGHATKYGRYKPYGNEQAHMSQNTWVLMTRDVLPDSRCKSYSGQCQLVAKLAQKSAQPYEVPHLIEAVTSIFMEYVKTGTCLYGRDPWTFTRCQEKALGMKAYQMAAGGVAAGGGLSPHHYGNAVTAASHGVGCAWKFLN
ncbi:MAG TPA: hypothetical protein PLO43_01945 [Chlamydiales bacterium]|nr:hypothetical protein [Chlamydiales bacterium]